MLENLRILKSTLLRVSRLVIPYGRKRLAFVVFSSLVQGILQVLGVTSIFPFLAMVADPHAFRAGLSNYTHVIDLNPFTDNQLLLYCGLFAIALLIVSNLVNLLSDFINVRYTYGFAHWLRLFLLRKILARPYDDFLQVHSGIFMKKVGADVAVFANSILLPMIGLGVRMVTISLLLITLLIIDPRIAVSAAVVFALFYLVVFKSLGSKRKMISEGLKQAQRRMSKELLQMIGGVKSVKVYRSEEYFLARYAAQSKEIARLNALIPILSNSPRYFIEPILFGGLVMLVLIYHSMGADLMSLLPTLGILALAGYRLLPAIQISYSMFTQITTSYHALDEVYDEFLAEDNAVDQGAESTSQFFPRPPRIQWHREIRLRNVAYTYAGASQPVFEGVDIVIPRNRSLGITGVTGSGKSTLVDLILGLHVPKTGQILADDTVICASVRRAWRAGIGYVPQEIYLIDDSVTANIAFGVRAADIDFARVRQAAHAARIVDFIEQELPHGFATEVGEQGVRLSGGQRQRIGLARALYAQPDILVLDEATSALDIATEAEIIRSIRDLSGELTMIIIAHRLSTIEHCDQRIDLSQFKPKGAA